MTKRTRRTHSAAFKAKVALAAVKGERAAGPVSSEPPVDVKTLHAKIGQLSLENDFLSGALTKAGLLSAKR
ncbi:transposase [Paraburkholderia kururiensis]